jgi:hypothetical protein
LAGGLNLYGYGEGDPLNNSDPFGLCVLWIKWCPPRDKHYARNQLNGEPVSRAQAQLENWRLAEDWESAWHRQGDGNETNQKYVSPDGHREWVFTGSGDVVTDALNRGTYNFGTSRLGHFVKDVVPYLLWGNAPDDPSRAIDRSVIVPARTSWAEAERFISAAVAAGATLVVR